MMNNIRDIKKQIKKIEKTQKFLIEALDMFDYCTDTKGIRVAGRKDEVEDSKNHAEDVAISAIIEARELLDQILKEYGAN
jgi:hypothetical protein